MSKRNIKIKFIGLIILFTVSSALLLFISLDKNTSFNPVNQLRVDTNSAYQIIRDDLDFESIEYMSAVKKSDHENIYTTIIDLKGNVVYSNSPFLVIDDFTNLDEVFYSDNSYVLSNEDVYKVAQPLYKDLEIQGFVVYEKMFTSSDKWSVGEWIICGIIAASLISMLIIMLKIIYAPYPVELKVLEKGLEDVSKGIFEPIKVDENSQFLSLHNTYNRLVQELMYIMGKKEHSEKQKKEFINKISHELKTPISTIKAYVEGLKNNVAKDEQKQKMYVDVIYEKMNQLTNIVNDFFVYTQDDSSHLKYNFEECYADEVINLIFDNIKKQGNDRTICENLLPKCIISCDKNRLEQVVLNLYNNSKKHTSAAEMINLRAYREDDNVVIEVSDYGCGISAEELPYIFDAYYQGDKSKKQDYQGVGLGLSICKSIVDAHNGYIKVKSQIDEGTSIYIYISVS